MKYNLETNKDELQELFPAIKDIFDLRFLENLQAGETKLNENDFCIKTKYYMRNQNEQFYESHRKYIDIHINLNGSEQFAYNDITKLKPTSTYDHLNDCILYDKKGPYAQMFNTKRADVMVFNPRDGHMSAVGTSDEWVEKVIVKVLNEDFSS